jgi:hypothetical protein
MGFFDLFKRKKSEEPQVEATQPQSAEPTPVVEEVVKEECVTSE